MASLTPVGDLLEFRTWLNSRELEQFVRDRAPQTLTGFFGYREELGAMILRLSDSASPAVVETLVARREELTDLIRRMREKGPPEGDAPLLQVHLVRLAALLTPVIESVSLVLAPGSYCDEQGNPTGPIPVPPLYFVGPAAESEKIEALRRIREVRIQIAPFAKSKTLRSTKEHDYIGAELGMNIIVPRGEIKELRFSVRLHADKPDDEHFVIDGFPAADIQVKHVLEGKIKVGLTKALEFIPYASAIKDVIDVDLEPWEFQFGKMKSVRVGFTGKGSRRAEWYFSGAGLETDLTLGLTIRKSKSVTTVGAYVEAYWTYDPGIFQAVRVASASKTISLHRPKAP